MNKSFSIIYNRYRLSLYEQKNKQQNVDLYCCEVRYKIWEKLFNSMAQVVKYV